MSFTVTRRNVLMGAGAGLATAAIAGCGSGTPGEEAPNGGDDGAAGAVTIKFWHRTFTPVENEWYANVVQQFNDAQDEVKVEVEEIPADAWDQRLTAAQAADQAPDIYTHSGAIQDAVNEEQLHELNDIVGMDVLEEIIESARPVSEIDGTFYAFPLLLEPQTVLFWNKDMFEAAGLDPETPPTTWDELFEFCEKLKPTLPEGTYCIAPAQDEGTFAWSTVGQQYQFSGHTALSDDWTEPTVEDDGYVALIEAYKTLWDNDYMPKQALAAYVEGSDFGQEKVAMKVSGSWMMSEIGSDYPDLLERTGVGRFVAAPDAGDRTNTTMGNFKWVIDAKTQNAEAAGKFMAWVLGGEPDVLVPFFVDTQFTKVPVRESVQTAVSESDAAADAHWSDIIVDEVSPGAIPEPTYPWDASLAVGTAMEAGMKGASSPQDALATAADTIRTVIERENLPEKAPEQ